MGVANHYAEFVAAVAKMRAAQREYFKTRSTQALRESKERERAVDDLVARFRVPPGVALSAGLIEKRGARHGEQ